MNTPLPAVSVIVPVYNAGPYLRRTLDSICGQSLNNIEIILVDDGSTDDSLAIMKEYAEQDTRITLLQQDHKYAGVARNNGMAVARGKYYSFLDADDVFESSMLEKMVARAEEVDADVVICKASVLLPSGEIRPLRIQLKGFYPDGLDREKFNVSEEMPQLLFAFQPWAWDKLFRAEYVQRYNLRFGHTRRVNDILFVYPATAAARVCSILDDEALSYYRLSDQQLSSSKSLSQDAMDMVYNAVDTCHKMEEMEISGRIMTAFRCRMASSLGWTLSQFHGQQRINLVDAIRSFESDFHLLKDIETAMRDPAFGLCIKECRHNLYLYAAITQTDSYSVDFEPDCGTYTVIKKYTGERPVTDALDESQCKRIYRSRFITQFLSAVKMFLRKLHISH